MNIQISDERCPLCDRVLMVEGGTILYCVAECGYTLTLFEKRVREYDSHLGTTEA